MYIKAIIICLICIVCQELNVLSQSIEKNLDSFFNTMHRQHDLNGCVLIAEKGKIVYKNAFGFSDYNTQKELTTNSVFELASISKQFTAMGIMILYEQGLLEYSSNIKTFFPEFPYDNITIRNLLNHTSGLPDYESIIPEHWDTSRIITNKNLIDIYQEYKPPLQFKPGDQYRYCNMGYILLASIIEKTSGLSYGEFMKRNIFIPLGMTRTRVYRRRYKPEIIDDYALGFVMSLKHKEYILPDSIENYKRVFYSDGLLGDGSINSTVEDLFLWDRCLYTNKPVSQKTLQEAFTPGKLNDGIDIDIGFQGDSYGFGWRIHNSIDGRVVWHTGHYPGYSTLIRRYTDIDRTIICLSNNGYEFYLNMDAINDILNGNSTPVVRSYFDRQLRIIFLDNKIVSKKDSLTTMINNKDNYIVMESRINELGYDLLNQNRIQDAISVFKCNTELFPGSANVYDSLGEAYMNNGQYKLAIINFRKSIELDPDNKNAFEKIRNCEQRIKKNN